MTTDTATSTAADPTMFRFRLVVRGTDAEGKRARRVRTVSAADYLEAWGLFELHAEAMADGLAEVAHQVLPPVGWKLNGEPSKGYEVEAA